MKQVVNYRNRPVRAGMIPLMLAVVSLLAATTTVQAVDTSTLINKVICGYYGLQTIPGDGSQLPGWHWWITSSGPPVWYAMDEWPQVVEYNIADLAVAPNTTLIGGGTPYLYSSRKPAVVDTHFRWMQEYNIDGVMMWRFLNNIVTSSAYLEQTNTITTQVKAKANKYQRGWCLEWDLSTDVNNPNSPQDATVLGMLQSEWNTLNAAHSIQSDPYYWRMNGKEVVVLWGFGYDFTEVGAPNTMPYSPTTAANCANWFKSQGCYVICGTGTPWRTAGGGNPNDGMQNNPAWQTVGYPAFDAITPWNFGYSTQTEVFNHQQNWIIPDKAWCDARGILFMPTTYPMFGNYNTNVPQGLPPGIFPPRGGQLLWDQFYRWKQAGVQTHFLAQFDEWFEAVAIAKVSDNVPTTGSWRTAEGNGSDWYLRLTNQGSKMQRGEIALSGTIPISPVASPDNAAVAGEDIPLFMSPGGAYPVVISMQNTGECGWNDSIWWAWGAPDSSDPFAYIRQYLPPGSMVPPGGYGIFTFNMVAPGSTGVSNTNWQMVHEAYRWFGPVVSKNVTVTNGLPAKALNPSPANGATNVNRVNLTASWSAASGATSYDLHGGAYTYPPPFLVNTAATSYFAGTLAPFTTYYWRVNARNGAGYQQGSIWLFTTGG